MTTRCTTPTTTPTTTGAPARKPHAGQDPDRLRKLAKDREERRRAAKASALATHAAIQAGSTSPTSPPPVPATGNLAWKRRVLIRLGNRSKSDIARVQAIRLLAQLDGELVDRSEDVTESPAERLERERIAWSLMTPVPEPDDDARAEAGQ